ncbi:cysteine and histidine-rich domain-containing protein 1 [Tetranychus urticae]|nr:cysteine and histidine-rich domain-containing protein 1 [Tetranychus urticae]
MCSTSQEHSLRCYNAACGKTYSELENSDDACTYHSGVPIFHDALKSWSCCSKKSTDFTEFLNFPGCTRGRHSNVKPQQAVKSSSSTDESVENLSSCMEQILNKPINLNDIGERPSADDPLIILKTVISPTLTKQLDKMKSENPTQKGLTDSSDVAKVEIGTSCKNNGCKKSYEGPHSNQEECLFHPGTPIFHEGMKYWSCCRKKTSDFETFLSQEGCESSSHLWFKLKTNENSDSLKTSCRYDWHQTGNNVVLTIYSKFPLPDKSLIKANRVKISVAITFGDKDEKIFSHDFILFGIIDTENSSVEFTPSKVEICMKKSDKSYWSRLEL